MPDAHRPGWRYVPDGVLRWDARGQITGFEEHAAWSSAPPSHPEVVWMPGFVDTHLHYPQTRIIGSATGPLLDWLERSTFPEEARFRDRGHAQAVAERFCLSMLRQGTTCASIYSSSHPGATEVLFEGLARHGMRAEVGLTLMDQGAPPELLLEAEAALDACEALIERWHLTEEGRLRFCITPRFALSCSSKLMRGAGALAVKHRLLMQTHISENEAEIEATVSLHPTAAHYLGVYHDHGLLESRSLFAHCIWLKDSEWALLKSLDGAVSHCPDSNFFLGSGQMSLKEAQHWGVRLGMGTDVGAGRSFSLRRSAARAYDASRISRSVTSAGELLWRATRGGAFALGREQELGAFEVGMGADVVGIRPPPELAYLEPARFERLTAEEQAEALCAGLVFCEDWDGVEQVRIAGQVRWSRNTSTATTS